MVFQSNFIISLSRIKIIIIVLKMWKKKHYESIIDKILTKNLNIFIKL